MLLVRKPVKAEGDVALFWKASRKREWALEDRSRRGSLRICLFSKTVLTQLGLERVGKPAPTFANPRLNTHPGLECKYWFQSGATMARSRRPQVAVKTVINRDKRFYGRCARHALSLSVFLSIGIQDQRWKSFYVGYLFIHIAPRVSLNITYVFLFCDNLQIVSKYQMRRSRYLYSYLQSCNPLRIDFFFFTGWNKTRLSVKCIMRLTYSFTELMRK